MKKVFLRILAASTLIILPCQPPETPQTCESIHYSENWEESSYLTDKYEFHYDWSELHCKSNEEHHPKKLSFKHEIDFILLVTSLLARPKSR
ncbi:hypothetical protein HCU40_12625 [Pseudanabaena biceps]|nr:hypothetical protein [Pseudanabaena biceps]